MEPERGLAGVTDVTPPPDALRDLYGARYARLVAVVGAIAGNRADAEEAVQEAFARLIGKWSTVGSYDDPEAWLRRVALGVLSNRRRKARNGLRALWRHGRQDVDDGPSGDSVDVRRALAALSQAQRAVVVLHHYVGLSVAEIAHELRIPVGTVKSRLSRGHAALAPMLREGIDDHA
ncbi:RNA polymerase sigma factor [Dactylosporangium cerinum]|uniref:RNA polymerase sigma factor n=1 Tax=Dactylosporangium cerinum TaxID=1434730 RepID=A0ABV9W3G8_9ACTN